MKKTFQKSLALAAVGSLFVVGSAMATPDYTGNTTADFTWDSSLEEQLPGINNDAFGYYLWSNDTRTEWSLRWIGDSQENFDWYGHISFRTIDLDTLAEISFEGADNSITGTDFVGDYITYEGYTGPHWDGVDFTITGGYGELEFYLGYEENDLAANQNNVAGVNIYIGSDFASTYVDIFSLPDDRLTQNFEIAAPIPEPTTMLLFGAGLAGLAGMSRRKKK